MAESFFPFDAGAGANVAEAQWREMAQHWLATGVLWGVDDLLEVYVDSSGMQVKVRTGAAWVQGHYYASDAVKTLPIATADAVNPRKDRIVVRADFVANTITTTVLQGTPAASPTAPPLTQSTGVHEFALATLTVGAGVTSIASAALVDDRRMVRSLFQVDALEGFVRDDESTTAATYSDLTTVGPSVPFTAPPSGRVLLHWSVGINAPAGQVGYCSPSIYDLATGTVVGSAFEAHDDRSAAGTEAVAAAPRRSGMVLYAGLNPGYSQYQARLRYRVTSGTGRFAFRRLVVISL